MTDAGHLLPDDEWALVVETAELELERILAELPADAPTRGARLLTAPLLPLSGTVVAARHGGARKAPTFGVLHSAETPLRAGYAASIAKMFATTKVDKSCHYMTDPAETWGVLDDLLVAWHCGNGNSNSIGLEQAGYARFSRAEWLVPDGIAQMTRNAEIMRAARARYGIALRWMTDDELKAAHARKIVGGWATHDQCRRVLGGTTHTDPMPGFPLDVQMTIANKEGTTVADGYLESDRTTAAGRHTQLIEIAQQTRGVLDSIDGKQDAQNASLGRIEATLERIATSLEKIAAGGGGTGPTAGAVVDEFASRLSS